MTREEQIARILDEWRTVSERDREAFATCAARVLDAPRAFHRVIDRIIASRPDMRDDG